MENQQISGYVYTTVYEQGINDLPYGWISENEWNKKVYQKWYDMLKRVYSEKFHSKNPTYITCTLSLEWHYLSKFVEDFVKIEGYDEKKFLNGELHLDKDIKSNGENKEYSLENCMLVSRKENNKQMLKTRKNKKGKDHPLYGRKLSKEQKEKLNENRPNVAGKNNPMFGKHHTNETLMKISEAKCGKVSRIDPLTHELLENKYPFEYEKDGYKSNLISCCVKGKQKTHKNFIFMYEKYYELFNDLNQYHQFDKEHLEE